MTFDNVAKGSIVKNVQGIRLENVKLNGKIVESLSPGVVKTDK